MFVLGYAVCETPAGLLASGTVGDRLFSLNLRTRMGTGWGVRQGILDRDRYLPAVRRAWNRLVRCLSDEGKVQWGQFVGDRPVAVKKDHSHEYVTGTFLLAGSEMLNLISAGVLPADAPSPTITGKC